MGQRNVWMMCAIDDPNAMKRYNFLPAWVRRLLVCFARRNYRASLTCMAQPCNNSFIIARLHDGSALARDPSRRTVVMSQEVLSIRFSLVEQTTDMKADRIRHFCMPAQSLDCSKVVEDFPWLRTFADVSECPKA